MVLCSIQLQESGHSVFRYSSQQCGSCKLAWIVNELRSADDIDSLTNETEVHVSNTELLRVQ